MADNSIVSRIYSNFRGVDFRGEEINLVRSPDALNMWKDYKETDSIRTRPELELFGTFEDTIYGIFFFNDGVNEIMFVHCGDKLYEIVGETRTEIYTGLNRVQSNGFTHGESWYFKDGKNFLVYKNTTITEVDEYDITSSYIPTTSIGRKPAGGGTTYEDVNLLSSCRINTFVGDGESTKYYLDSTNLGGIQEIRINGEVWEGDYVDYMEEGYVLFNEAPPAPLTDGQDNVSITYWKHVDGYIEKILNCTLLEVFDNRVFFSGNPDYPNYVWHSSLNNPLYCSDLDYYIEGMDNSMIKGLVAGNNALWVFKEPSQSNTTIFYHVPTIDSEYGKIYPSTHSNISAGCVGKAINFNDDIVFFSDRGMEGVSGDITTEQVIAHRSSMIDRKLIAEQDYENMSLVEWEGYLIAFIGSHAYLADSRAMLTNENHTEYEWFYWELGKDVIYAKVHKGVLYIGTDDGIYTLTDTTANVQSYWTTPKDKFKYPQRLKTTNKRGCVAEAKGDIAVYVKTENSDFELVGAHYDITDYFVSRIKRKKFKDLQLKFYSGTRFSLETATLEVFVGGYIKR